MRLQDLGLRVQGVWGVSVGGFVGLGLRVEDCKCSGFRASCFQGLIRVLELGI